MSKPIGIRIPKEILKKIEKIGKEEMQDRSTVIRKLVLIGYLEFIKERAAEQYLKGNLTLSGAALQAGLNLWEMEKYLVENGFKSNYSIEDLEKEMAIL